jgi:tRNA-2-methylthio-N6-dimethylallyladenosine synthase
MKFYIETFGCQMNEHDTEKMAYLLVNNGFEHIQNMKDADIVIVNTCCVREKAEQKFYSLMGRLRGIKKRRNMLLGVTGCVAQMEKDSIKKRLPFIDFSLGPSSIHKIKEAIEEASKRRQFFDFSENGCSTSLFIKPKNIDGKVKTCVTIMKGCNNFCSYCVVPYVRGREESRDSKDVLKEIEDLASEGVREVTLLGQNVNSYNRRRDDISFPQILEAINRIQGIKRIRFVTSHPKDISFELIGCFGRLEKLCEHIHLPFQSGSDKVLKRMNRGYTAQEYIEKIGLLRDRCKDISITADCIVGFPGEDEEDFAKTMDLIKDVGFDGIFSFVYSPRKYTVASTLEDVVPREVAKERLRYLQGVQKSITLNKNREMEDKRVDVLVEGTSKNSEQDLTGRTRTNKIVNFKGDRDMIGKFVEVEIVKGYANSLKGEKPEIKEV